MTLANPHCAECGAELPPGLSPGLCPRCALQAAAVELPATESGPLPLPHAFGDYVLLDEIARGGMGIVYKARQKSLDRFVAVKLLLAGSFASHDLIRRFKSEGIAAGRLQHPNIVAIHEVGVHDEQHFLVMYFVDGPNLAALVRGQPLPAGRAANYLKPIAEAIHAAHEREVL